MHICLNCGEVYIKSIVNNNLLLIVILIPDFGNFIEKSIISIQ